MFKTQLDIRVIGEQSFELLNPLIYDDSDFIITIYPGFVFDGASIPKALWSIIGCPIGGLYSSAACLHDAMYSSHLLNKEMSDKKFREAMISSGVPHPLAEKMYLGVRDFGKSSYDNAQNLQKYRDLIKIELKNKG